MATITGADLPMIGQTRRTLFWVILLIALLALTALVNLASRGAIAMAATIPVPFTTVNQQIKATNFKLFPGVSQADKSTPVVVQQLDATITGMKVIKSFSLAGHTITFTMTAGDHGTPVTASGLTMDASSVNVGNVQFSGMTLSAGGSGGLENDASSATFTNATIVSPFLLANSMTLPGLSISLNFG
jgi:hypothetical protein